MRYEENIVFVGARHKHVRIHERYGSTYIPPGPVRHSPQLEQASSARDPFRDRDLMACQFTDTVGSVCQNGMSEFGMCQRVAQPGQRHRV